MMLLLVSINGTRSWVSDCTSFDPHDRFTFRLDSTSGSGLFSCRRHPTCSFPLSVGETSLFPSLTRFCALDGPRLSRAMNFEAPPDASRFCELGRNGPYTPVQCMQVNEIKWRTPLFATTRPSVRSLLAAPPSHAGAPNKRDLVRFAPGRVPMVSTQ